MRSSLRIALLVLSLLACGRAIAQADDAAPQYLRTGAFNAPILEGWADQSTADVAQFHLPAAGATIRTALATAEDPPAAAQADLAAWLGGEVGPPVYRDKVNLADGTWSVLVYDIDAATTASVMARRAAGGYVVISFVERDAAARTVMLTAAQAEEALDEAEPEIARALQQIAGVGLEQLEKTGNVELPSGQWGVYERAGLSAMGMVFGNDSYIALGEGEIGDLAALAEAWNRTLLGFFITPDNSGYLLLGLAAVFAVLGTLLFSFAWRSRGIQKDLALLEALEREGG